MYRFVVVGLYAGRFNGASDVHKEALKVLKDFAISDWERCPACGACVNICDGYRYCPWCGLTVYG